MTLEPHELLQRLSDSLRGEIGPAVGDEYTRTQAFMASVILEKLARQLSLAAVHQQAAAADLLQLHADLADRLVRVSDLAGALERARAEATIGALGPLIEALYGSRDPRVDEALGLIRAVLRRDIDRRMEIAR